MIGLSEYEYDIYNLFNTPLGRKVLSKLEESVNPIVFGDGCGILNSQRMAFREGERNQIYKISNIIKRGDILNKDYGRSVE